MPVCALTAAESGKLREWYTQWDSFVRERSEAASALAGRIEKLLEGSKTAGASGGSAKEVVSELTELYGELEESQRELTELDAPTLDDERLASLQRGIQRFAALARFG